MYKSKYKPMRFNTTFDLAITALIEFSSLGLYFIGTIWEHKKSRENQSYTLEQRKDFKKIQIIWSKNKSSIIYP